MGVEVWKLWPSRILETGEQPEPIYVMHTFTGHAGGRMVISLTEAEALALAERLVAAVHDE